MIDLEVAGYGMLWNDNGLDLNTKQFWINFFINFMGFKSIPGASTHNKIYAPSWILDIKQIELPNDPPKNSYYPKKIWLIFIVFRIKQTFLISHFLQFPFRSTTWGEWNTIIEFINKLINYLDRGWWIHLHIIS